jgi:pilus assembly protein CpaB
MRKQKRRGLLFGMLAVALALFTGFLFSSTIAALEKQIGDMQQVVFVKQDVEPRTLITADMLEVREIPRKFAHPSYVQSIEEVAGQRVAVTKLEPDAILRLTDVAPTSGLEDGMRAISIGVNPVAVHVDRIQPGSRVDVVVSYVDMKLDSQGKEVESRETHTVLQDIEVLAINGTPVPRNDPAAEAQPEEQTTSGGIFGGISAAPPDSLEGRFDLEADSDVIATMKVTPEQAMQLAYMDTFATDIRLSLRRPDDDNFVPMAPVTTEDFK